MIPHVATPNAFASPQPLVNAVFAGAEQVSKGNLPANVVFRPLKEDKTHNKNKQPSKSSVELKTLETQSEYIENILYVAQELSQREYELEQPMDYYHVAKYDEAIQMNNIHLGLTSHPIDSDPSH